MLIWGALFTTLLESRLRNKTLTCKEPKLECHREIPILQSLVKKRAIPEWGGGEDKTYNKEKPEGCKRSREGKLCSSGMLTPRFLSRPCIFDLRNVVLVKILETRP